MDTPNALSHAPDDGANALPTTPSAFAGLAGPNPTLYDLTAERDLLYEEVERLNTLQHDLEKVSAQQNEIIARLTEESAARLRQIDLLDKELQIAKVTAAQNRALANHQDQEITRLNKELKPLTEIAEQYRALRKTCEAQEAALAKGKHEEQLLRAWIERVEAAKKAVERSYDELKKRKDAHEMAAAEEAVRIAAAERTVQLTERIEALEAESTQLAVARNEATIALERLKEKMEGMRRTADKQAHAAAHLANAQAEIARMKEDRAAYMATAEALREVAERAHAAEIHDLQAELAEARQQEEARPTTIPATSLNTSARSARSVNVTSEAEVAAALQAHRTALQEAKDRLAEAHEAQAAERSRLMSRKPTLLQALRKADGEWAAELRSERAQLEGRLTEMDQSLDTLRATCDELTEACERLERRLEALRELETPLAPKLLAPPYLRPPLAQPSPSERPIAPAPTAPPPKATRNAAAAEQRPSCTEEERLDLFMRLSDKHGNTHAGAFLFLALVELLPEQGGKASAVLARAQEAGLCRIGKKALADIQRHLQHAPMTIWLQRDGIDRNKEWIYKRTRAAAPWPEFVDKPVFNAAERERFLAAQPKTE